MSHPSHHTSGLGFRVKVSGFRYLGFIGFRALGSERTVPATEVLPGCLQVTFVDDLQGSP